MKILFLIHQYFPDNIGGTEILLHDLAKNMQAQGHEVAIFAYRESAESNPAAFGTREDEHDGICVHRFHFNLSLHPDRLEGEFNNHFCDQALRGVVEDFSPDVAHVVHAMKLGGGIFDVLSEAGVPVVTTLSDYWYFCLRHSLLLPDQSPCKTGPEPVSQCLSCLMNQFALDNSELAAAEKANEGRNRYLRQAVLQSSALIALSDHQRDTYIRFGFPVERMAVARHGVNVAQFVSAREHHRLRPRVEKGRALRLLFVGNLLPHKGLHLLIEALLLLPGVEVELRIVGDPNKDGFYMKPLVEKSAADARIMFAGQCEHDQLGAHYEWCDRLVMPSIWDENEPLVVKEARWCGIPVVAHALPGLGELVREEADGCIIGQSTVAGWCDWLEQLTAEMSRYLPPRTEVATTESFAVEMLGYFEKAVIGGKLK